MFPKLLLVELCHAQYCVPKPLALLPVAVLMTYCTWVFELALVLPKCAAALAASAANCDCVGRDGAAEPLSYHEPPYTPLGLTACVPEEPQVTVPEATPWQYCVTELFHELPPTPLKKACWMPASPLGSLEPLVPHCEPQ